MRASSASAFTSPSPVETRSNVSFPRQDRQRFSGCSRRTAYRSHESRKAARRREASGLSMSGIASTTAISSVSSVDNSLHDAAWSVPRAAPSTSVSQAARWVVRCHIHRPACSSEALTRTVSACDSSYPPWMATDWSEARSRKKFFDFVYWQYAHAIVGLKARNFLIRTEVAINKSTYPELLLLGS